MSQKWLYFSEGSHQEMVRPRKEQQLLIIFEYNIKEKVRIKEICMGEKKSQERNCIKGSQKNSHIGNKSSYNSSGSIKFNKSDIVWAKITGYPWWPALVTTVPGEKEVSKRSEDLKSYYPWSHMHHNVKADYRVDFIADDTHAFLRKNYLLDYKANRDRLYVQGLQFSTRKRRYFQMAVNEADQLQQVMELSRMQMNSDKKSNVQREEGLIKNCDENDVERQNQSQGQQQQQQQSFVKSYHYHYQKQQQQQQIIQEQNQSHPYDKLNKLTKLKPNQPKSNKSSLSISHRTKTSLQQCNSTKKNAKINRNQTGSHQTALKRSRNLSNKPQPLKQTQTRINSQQKAPSNDIESQLFVRFEVSEKRATSICRNPQLQVVQKQSQQFQQIIQLELNNQNTQRSASNEKPHSLSIQSTVNDLIPIKATPPDMVFEQLLTKYNLHNIEQVQQQYKRQKLAKRKDEPMESISSNQVSISTTTNKICIKNAFTATCMISRKKHSKKSSTPTPPLKHYNTESHIFAQNLSIISKLKPSSDQKLSHQQKHFLIQTSKRRTARKIYSTVLHSLLKSHQIEPIEEQIKENIRDRCKRISSIIFQQQEYGDRCRGQRKLLIGGKNGNKGKCHGGYYEGENFLVAFKRKLEQNVTFLRYLSMQNWHLLSQMSSLPTELRIEIKSLQQFLQTHCHLQMRNQEKFADIAKQIAIDNQKTAFAYLHPPIEIMDIENDYGHISTEKMVMGVQEGFGNVEKKSSENACVETK